MAILFFWQILLHNYQTFLRHLADKPIYNHDLPVFWLLSCPRKQKAEAVSDQVNEFHFLSPCFPAQVMLSIHVQKYIPICLIKDLPAFFLLLTILSFQSCCKRQISLHYPVQMPKTLPVKSPDSNCCSIPDHFLYSRHPLLWDIF